MALIKILTCDNGIAAADQIRLAVLVNDGCCDCITKARFPCEEQRGNGFTGCLLQPS